MIIPFFLVMLGCCVALALFASGEPASTKVVSARLATISSRIGEGTEHQITLTQKSKQRLSDRIGERVKSYRLGESLEQLLIHAASNLSVGKVLMLSSTIAVATMAVMHVFVDSWLIVLCVSPVSAISPYGYLLFQRSRRVAKFNAALADAIDLMARALRAGHSMASSIEVIAEQSPEPLATEFAMCFQQQKFGIPFRDALLAMGQRVPSDDLQFLITAVLVQKETGGDLTDILDRTTAVIRDRIRIQGEISTRTAQGRMTGWILSSMPLILLVVINFISPGYTDVLFADSLGQKLLIGGAASILVGGFIISKIVDIKV